MSVGEGYSDYLVEKGRPPLSIEMKIAIDRAKLFYTFTGATEEVERIEEVVRGITAVLGPNPPGQGDRFKKWCVEHNRELPADRMVALMNTDPPAAMTAIKHDPKHPRVWRAMATYISRGGLRV